MSTVGLCCRRRTREKLIFLLFRFLSMELTGRVRGAGQSCGMLFSVFVLTRVIWELMMSGGAPASAGLPTLTRSRKGHS